MISAIYSGIMYNIAIKPIRFLPKGEDSRMKGSDKWKIENIWIRKQFNEGSKFYLDGNRWRNLFFDLDNIFRIGLVVLYFSWTISIVV